MYKSSTKRQKVILVITKSNWGGAQKYVYDIATGLHARGFDVQVATGGTGEMTHRLQERGVRVLPLLHMKNNMNPIGSFRAFMELVSLFRREQPEVVHINSSKAGLFGTLAGRLANVPHIIFTAHGWPFNEERPLWQKIILRGLMKMAVLASHKTICVSNKTKIDLRAGSMLYPKCVIIHNGIGPISFKSPTAFYEDFRQIRRERIAMVSIGELHPSKGFHIALTYLSQLRDLSWEWFILGEGYYRTQIEILIKKHNLTSRVHLLGHTKDAAQYLESFDLFFLPSRTEALAYVAIEALQSTLPIIASNVGGIPEVLAHDPGSTLIDIRNASSIETLREILSSPIRKITSGRNELRKEFSLELMIEKTIKIYEE